MRILYLPNSYSQQRQHEKKANIYPVRMAMEAEWYRKQGYEVFWHISDKSSQTKHFANTNKLKVIYEPENLPFLTLPRPDRVFTRAKEYSSGNYKYLPGTHIMSASGCWHGKCTFCIENGKPYEVREIDDVLSEILECELLGFRDIFDDSGTFPVGSWLHEFCENIINEDWMLHLGCNMRITKEVDFKQMKQAGFRMLLFGVESANQETLDRIGKGVRVDDIIPTIKRAAKEGLEPHIAVMFGYSWENDEQSIATLRLVHYLLRKGYAKTAQASFYTTKDGANESQRKYVRRIYEAAYYPNFWFQQLSGIHNIADIKYLWLKIKKGLGR